VIGSTLEQGMRPQLLVPGGTFHAARLVGDGHYSLMGTSVWLVPSRPTLKWEMLKPFLRHIPHFGIN
jgi:predicted cupin superfamily sugar epimerase